MNETRRSKRRSVFVVVVFFCGALLAGSGCASYLRTGQMSDDELRQQNQDRQSESKISYDPDSEFDSGR
jgi:hypothetical protein